MRTIDGDGDRIVLIDQTVLPEAFVVLELRSIDALIDAIVRLAVRGAPALGAAGGFGVALAAVHAERHGLGPGHVRAEAERLAAARPTAVNLSWGVRQVLAHLDQGTEAVVAAARRLADEDVAANRALGGLGADLLVALRGTGLTIHTHCNTGALACVDWGTALGVVRTLHDRGQLRGVVVDETRPLLQGSRLTAWELDQLGIEHHVVVDGAGPSIIARGLVDAVVVGADRIAANGDTANKIGTYPLALAAMRAGVPFVVAAPESTIDLATPTGEAIDIEDRSGEEVLGWRGVRVAPAGSRAMNPAFDITPHDLVTAIVTERRVIRLDRGATPAEVTAPPVPQ